MVLATAPRVVMAIGTAQASGVAFDCVRSRLRGHRDRTHHHSAGDALPATIPPVDGGVPPVCVSKPAGA